MRKKECPSCAMQVDSKLEICPVCEYEFPDNAGSGAYRTVIAILLLILFLGMIFWGLFT